MLADDDPHQLKLTRFRLSALGFEVETANDGEEALAAARRSSPDVIVSDVMMPKMDGFALALAVRQDPALARTPLLLVSSTYLEDSDRELARRSGANDMLLRTPELAEVVGALRQVITAKRRNAPSPAEPLPELEKQRAQTLLRQLERQVLLNTGLAKRCSALASELTIIAGISEAVLKHRDLDVAIDEALAACFDAGGISVGALYLLGEHGTLRVRALGGGAEWPREEIESFFGQEALLRDVMASGTTLTLPSPKVPMELSSDFLRRTGGTAALTVPLVHLSRPLGALLMVSRGRDLDGEQWAAFAYGVGNQIAQVLALANAYAEKGAAESQANDQAALMRLILDSVAEGVIVCNAEGEFLIWNPAARKLVPPGPSDVPNTEWPRHYGLYRSDGSELMRADELPLLRAMKGELLDELEMLVRPSEGAPDRWLRVTARPLITAESEPRGAVAVMRDVTAQKWAEREVLQSRAEWQALVEQMPDIVIRMDLDGTIQFINQSRHGYQSERVVGTNWARYVTPDQAPLVQEALNTVVHTGAQTNFEVSIPDMQTGEGLWYSCNLGPVRSHNDTVGAIMIARNITQKKQTEAQLIVSDRMASIGTLAAGVAHEINNPLSSVIANLDLALKGVQATRRS